MKPEKLLEINISIVIIIWAIFEITTSIFKL